MKSTLVARLAAVGLAAAAAIGMSLTAQAAEVLATPSLSVTPFDSTKVSPDLSAAMQRDLGLTRSQVFIRFAQEAKAADAERTAERSLGAAYAGSWFDPDSGRLVVQSTDLAKAYSLKDVEVRHAARPLAELDGVKAGIDALAGKAAPVAISGWYVDVKANDVVVTVNRTRVDAAAKAFLAKLDAGVRVVETDQSPRPYADVYGAYPFYINGSSRCSIGFAVYGGFVTAGHCGRPGYTATSHTGELLGYFAGSVFPYYDHSWVRTVGGVNLWPYMYGYNGYYYYVYGSSEMPVGAGICRSGSTTGMWCGTVQAKNQTVNYPQGTVYGLTRTNVCAEPGDSGGSWLSANQAQGVTSGGSGNCSSGGTTYFQPVNPILSYWGLTLITA
jgi:streptogrisin C